MLRNGAFHRCEPPGLRSLCLGEYGERRSDMDDSVDGAMMSIVWVLTG